MNNEQCPIWESGFGCHWCAPLVKAFYCASYLLKGRTQGVPLPLLHRMRPTTTNAPPANNSHSTTVRTGDTASPASARKTPVCASSARLEMRPPAAGSNAGWLVGSAEGRLSDVLLGELDGLLVRVAVARPSGVGVGGAVGLIGGGVGGAVGLMGVASLWDKGTPLCLK